MNDAPTGEMPSDISVENSPADNAPVENNEPQSMQDTLAARLQELRSPEEGEEPVKPAIKPVASTEPKPTTTDTEEDPTEEKPESTITDWNKVPTAWSKQFTPEQWNELPEGARQRIVQREKEFMQGIQKNKTLADFGDAVSQELYPYNDILQSEGNGDPILAIKTLAQTAAYMRRASPQHKGEAFANLTKRFNVDIPTMLQHLGINPGETGQQVNSASENAYKSEIARLEGELNKVQSYINKQEQTAAGERYSKVESEIVSFANTTNADGTLKYPYFNDVINDMALIIRSKPGTPLEKAYNIAVNAHPEVSARLEQQKLAQSEAQRNKEATKNAVKAKRAMSANVRTSGQAGSPQRKDETLNETLLNRLRETRGE